MINWKSTTSSYIKYIRTLAKKEIDWFRKQETLRAAIEVSASAKNCEGKRYSHQWRITHEALTQANERLLAIEEEISRVENFDQLICLLEKNVRPIHGIGELYVYDTALRIGAKLGKLPNKVYLHAGARDGAKASNLRHKIKRTECNLEYLEKTDFPAIVHQLDCHEIEDMLCIYCRHGKENDCYLEDSNCYRKRAKCA